MGQESIRGLSRFETFFNQGEDQSKWKEYDATELVQRYNGPLLPILIDQGSEDDFLKQNQLLPEHFIEKSNGKVKLDYRLQLGYDHSYWFIQTFGI